jgi:serine phosphatase RsbU (regulator of sigma subunit)
VVRESRHLPAAQIAENIVSAVAAHRAGFPSNDDTTVVVVKITD